MERFECDDETADLSVLGYVSNRCMIVLDERGGSIDLAHGVPDFVLDVVIAARFAEPRSPGRPWSTGEVTLCDS